MTKISSLSTKRETRPEIKKKDICKKGCHKNWNQASTIIKLTRVPLTTFTSINTSCTVKKPFFPLYYITGTVKNTVSFRTVHYKIHYFLFGGEGEGGGGIVSLFLKNGNGERENEKW